MRYDEPWDRNSTDQSSGIDLSPSNIFDKAKQFFNYLGGLPKPVEPVDPISLLMSQYNSMLNQSHNIDPLSFMGGKTSQQLAAEAFAPALKQLDTIGNRYRQRYDAGKQDINGIYAALSREAISNRDADKANYDKVSSQIAGDYGAATQQAKQAFTSSKRDEASTLARLGIGDVAGVTGAKTDNALADKLADLAARQANAVTTNRQLGANDYSYGTNTSLNQKKAGAQAAQEYEQQFLSAMDKLDMSRSDLSAQQAMRGLDLEQKIAQMVSQASNASTDSANSWFQNMFNALKYQQDSAQRSQQDQLDLALKAQYNNANIDTDMAKLELEKAKYLDDVQNRNVSPTQKALANALKYHQGNSDAATQSAQLFLNALSNPENTDADGKPAIASLLRAVQDDPVAQKLVFDYFQGR